MLRVWTTLVALAALLACAPAAQGATFRVLSTQDTPADVGCEGTDCPSIRAALLSAAITSEPDTIVVPEGVYQLTTGQLLIDTPVTIEGEGARTTTVSGNPDEFRVLEVAQGVTATVSGLTLRDGQAHTNGTFLAGGVVRNSGTLTLDRVRVTGGRATSGGGIANTGGTLTLTRSLVDHNAADLPNAGNDAGGLLNFGGGTLTVRDSTIAYNNARQAGAFLSWGGDNSTTFERVTIARNSAYEFGTGGIASGEGALFVRASILAGNTVQGAPSDCGTGVTSLGFNVAGTCNLDGTGDRLGVDPLLGPDLADAGGDTDVLELAASSPALDLFACEGADQRGLARPQKRACDAGAVEVDTPPTVTFTQQPPPVTNDVHPSFTFVADEPDVTFECVHVLPDGTRLEWPCTDPLRDLVDGRHAFEVRATDATGNTGEPAIAAFTVDTIAPDRVAVTHSGPASFTFAGDGLRFECRLEGPAGAGPEPCTSPRNYGALAPGAYVFTLVPIDAAGNRGPATRLPFTIDPPPPAPTPPVLQVQPSPAPTPVPTPAPTPEAGKSAVGRASSGTILVRRPGTNTFVRLERSASIPMGSEIDAKKGRVVITIQPGPGRRPQRATFYGGIFRITQSGATATLTLSEPLAPCRKRASAAQRKPKKRKLWGDGKGKFRTKGRYSAATVRGTKWLVEDSCAGTLTRVTQGVVAVRDTRKRKTVLVRAGKRYVARP